MIGLVELSIIGITCLTCGILVAGVAVLGVIAMMRKKNGPQIE